MTAPAAWEPATVTRASASVMSTPPKPAVRRLTLGSAGLTLAFVAASLATTGCTTRTPLAPGCRPWQSSDGSTEPPTHCMFFPGALALDPLGDVLYVANTNADLSFGGATVISVDVMRHERAVACFRRHGNGPELAGDAECGRVACSDSGYALGKAATVEDTERHEAQSQQPAADFDRCYCERDLDDPGVINCEPQRFVISDQTVKVGFFPAEMTVLAEDPPDWTRGDLLTDVPADWNAVPGGKVLHRGLYLSVRGDPSVTLLNVRRTLQPGRPATRSLGIDVTCGQPSPGKHTPGDAYTLRQCEATSRVQRTFDDVLVDPLDPSQGTRARFDIPAEPFSLQIDRGCVQPGYTHTRGDRKNGTPRCFNGTDDKSDYYQYLAVTHLLNGQISSYDLGLDPSNPTTPVMQDVSDPLFPPDSTGRRGGFAIAPRRRGDLSQPWYATSRVTGQISTFRLATVGGPRVVPGLIMRLENQFTTVSQDVRQIQFEPSGDRAFATIYTPPSLAIIDTRQRGPQGVPVNQVTGIVNLCPGPSRTVLARVPWANMNQTTLASKLYVSCYLSGQLAEVDADSGELTGMISTGRGPLSIALNFGGAGPTNQGIGSIDPCADPYVGDAEAKLQGVTCPAMPSLRPAPLGPAQPGLGPRAYISNYLDSTVSVIDLDPRSPSYRRLVSRIGLPSPKQVQ